MAEEHHFLDAIASNWAKKASESTFAGRNHNRIAVPMRSE